MNYKIKLLYLITFIGITLTTSCRNGKKNPPLISISETNMEVLPNQKINIEVTFERGDRKIKDLSIIGIGDDIIIDDIDNKAINTYNYEATIPSNTEKTTITVTFSAKDTRKNETTVDLVLEVKTPFPNETLNGIINNGQGPSSHGWDMVENVSKSTADGGLYKDIFDQTSSSTGVFLEGGWTSGNLTTFVVGNNYDYDLASMESANSAFENGTEISFINAEDLEVDDVILIKIRGEENYGVIKIIEVFDDGKDGGTGGNTDYRKFIYKN